MQNSQESDSQESEESLKMALPVDTMTERAAAASSKVANTSSDKVRYPFWFGGSASGMAACVTHPLDLGMPRNLSYSVWCCRVRQLVAYYILQSKFGSRHVL